MSKTRLKIIDVAKSLFAVKSAYKATMDDIATAAKVSRRTLYTHFKNKEDLYNVVIEDEVNRINERLQKAANSHLPPHRKLKLFIIQHFMVIDNLVTNNRYLRYDFLFDNKNIEKLRVDIDRKELEMLVGIVKLGKRDGIFVVNDPIEFAHLLLLMFKSLESAYIIDRTRSNKPRNVILIYINLLFYGVINKEAEKIYNSHSQYYKV